MLACLFHFRARVATVVVAMLVATGIAGCSSESLSPEADHFKGLNPAVVTEVLANPAARQKFEEAGRAKDETGQAIVLSFSVCRDVFRVYTEWMRTGLAPDLEPLPVPTHPVEPLYSDWKTLYAEVGSIIQSGDLQELRSWLAGDGGCGSGTPATPDDADGPTIKDIVEG